MDNLKLEKLKTETMLILAEARYNHNHDAKGRFGTSSGGSGVTADVATQVKEKTDLVNSRLSNEVKPFKKESKPNMNEIKSRGDASDEEAKQALDVANKVYNKAAQVEPQITNDVVSTVAEQGGKMYGLDFRMKQPTSMAGKIADDAKHNPEFGGSFDGAGADVKDAVRYTAVFDEKDFTKNYNQVKSNLESKGYKEVRCKNFYEMYENKRSEQKAVQCVYENKDGYKFEFQFHTPASQGAKELNHPLYEESRKATTKNQEKKRLKKKMKQIGTHVNNPPGVMSIKSHG